MTPRSLRLIAAGSVVALGGLGVASAHGQSWRAPVYPATTGANAISFLNQSMGLAQSGNGAATLLYRASDQSIRGVQRASASSAWSKAAIWLPASKAKAGRSLEAVVSGSKVWAMWTQQSGTRLSTTTGTRTAGNQKQVRTTSLGGTAPSPVLTLTGAGSRGNWGAFLPATAFNGAGPAQGGSVSAGRAPALTNAATTVPTVGGSAASGVQFASNASGAQVAVTSSLAGVGYSTLPAGASWTPAAAVTPRAVASSDGGGSVAGAFTSPFDVAMDADGNAAMAYVAYVDANGALTNTFATTNNVAVVTSTRIGATGTFSAPTVLQVIPRPATAPVGSFLNVRQVAGVTVAMAGGTTVVGFVTWVNSVGTGPPTLWVSRGATGQALPAPTQLADPNGDQSQVASYGLDGLQSSVTPSGNRATVAFGIELTQGNTDGLWATTSTSPTAAWPQLVDVSRCTRRSTGASGGFGDWQLSPWNSGFTIAFQCTPSAPARNAVPNMLGIATFR